MPLDINKMNVRSWETLVQITLIQDLLRTAGKIPHQGNINRQKDNNAIVNISVDEIILHENEKVSVMREEHEKVESDFYYNKLYQIDSMSLEGTKGKLE